MSPLTKSPSVWGKRLANIHRVGIFSTLPTRTSSSVGLLVNIHIRPKYTLGKFWKFFCIPPFQQSLWAILYFVPLLWSFSQTIFCPLPMNWYVYPQLRTSLLPDWVDNEIYYSKFPSLRVFAFTSLLGPSHSGSVMPQQSTFRWCQHIVLSYL